MSIVMGHTVKVKLTGGVMPRQGTAGANGYDISARSDCSHMIMPGQRKLIPTGVSLEMPWPVYAFVVPRSGLAVKFGITVLNAPGLVDSDFRGEVQVILINHGDETFTVMPGDRIAQLVFSERVVLEVADELGATERGDGGFGSTGR